MRSIRNPALKLPMLAAMLWLGSAIAQDEAATGVVAPGPDECVILLHGLGRTFLSMEPLAWALRDAGYVTANIDYPSRERTVEELAEEALPRGIERCHEQHATRISVVTHSMGGILTRHYLGRHELPDLGRVVMLGPPNQGSAVADRLMDQAVYRTVNGPAGQQLGTGSKGIAARLGPVEFPLGVLAGRERTAIDEMLSDGIEGEGDGKVLVEEARVEGMADFRVLDANHTFILSDPTAISEVLHFLRAGTFSPKPAVSVH